MAFLRERGGFLGFYKNLKRASFRYGDSVSEFKRIESELTHSFNFYVDECVDPTCLQSRSLSATCFMFLLKSLVVKVMNPVGGWHVEGSLILGDVWIGFLMWRRGIEWDLGILCKRVHLMFLLFFLFRKILNIVYVYYFHRACFVNVIHQVWFCLMGCFKIYRFVVKLEFVW
jgi:hypothetical protein